MSSLIMKSHPLLKLMNNSLVDLPSPTNISFAWNMGSLLGMTLMLQIMTGLFLSLHYCNDASLAFSSVVRICYEVNYGWILRTLHANGGSMFFICLYLHTGRGMYYGSYRFMETWNTGVILLFLTMATAFLGYVLPWGQMSFWGATVITNLLSAVPYVGKDLVIWLWGGFAVSAPTLSRFFAFHFLLPFVLIGVVMIHLMFLHQTGSTNPLGTNSNFDKLPFHPYFSIKDVMGFLVALTLLVVLSLYHPWLLGDPDNFIPANPLSTPPHIQPEWYFLFAYAILRAIPNKLGGVIALVVSIMILMILPFTNNFKFQSLQFYPINKFLFWTFLNIVLILTWIGARPVEDPYVLIGQIFTVIYFLYFLINPMIHHAWNKLI